MPWPDMPKHLGKDAFLQMLEARYAAKDKAAEALAALRDGVALTKIGTVADVAIQAQAASANPNPNEFQEMEDHLNKDWFDRDPKNHWWINWEGDAGPTLRELLVRALELSLGVTHDTTVRTKNAIIAASPRKDPWPIEFFWVCGLPRFEGYISWKKQRVTVILLTPGFVSPTGSRWRFPVQDFEADREDAIGRLVARTEGIMFVGQNLVSNNGPHVIVGGPPVVHHLSAERGGVGSNP